MAGIFVPVAQCAADCFVYDEASGSSQVDFFRLAGIAGCCR
jgi:hypothetical protein